MAAAHAWFGFVDLFRARVPIVPTRLESSRLELAVRFPV